jgi:hypothetical protein
LDRWSKFSRASEVRLRFVALYAAEYCRIANAGNGGQALRKSKPFVDPRQLPLFPEYQDVYPLCGAASELTTCHRLYNTQRACLRCMDGLRRYGWKPVRLT